MAGIDAQKQLLSLISDFTSERSRREQRVVNLKKQVESLQSEVEAANSELENAKRIKLVAEEELNGCEVELYLNDATIHSLEARITLLQDEVSTIGNEMDALKNEEGLLREFHKIVDSSFANDGSTDITATDIKLLEGDSGANPEIENMLSDLNSQLAKEEEGYLAEQKIQEQTSELEQTFASLGEELQKKCPCQHFQAENVEVLSFLLQED